MAVGDSHRSKPRACPKCRGRKLATVSETITGLKPWRCLRSGCGAIGYEDRVVGDPIVLKTAEKPPPRKRRSSRYGAQKPRTMSRRFAVPSS